MSDFRITVIVPCFNCGKYLDEAIASVFSQHGDFDLVEVLVIDDRSDDQDTRKKLRKHSAVEGISVIGNEEPQGPAGARNTGLRHARGDWIAFLDADDVLTENSLQVRLEAARLYPSCSWVGGDFYLGDENLTLESETFFRSRPKSAKLLEMAFVTNGPILLERPVRDFIVNPPTNMCAGLIRRKLIEEIGGFDTSLEKQHDYHLFLRLAAVADFVFTPNVVMLYRTHGSSWSADEMEIAKWRIEAIRNLVDLPPYDQYRELIFEKMSALYLSRSRMCRESKDWLDAAKNALHAVRYNPSQSLVWKNLVASLILRT